MKVCEKYNMKKAFEAKSDWDFTIFMVMNYEIIDGRVYRLKTPRLIPVHRFTLFAVTVIEASKIKKSINVLPQYICTIDKISE
nr:MAG TPA: hypothetical protein [Microviridae sp.]